MPAIRGSASVKKTRRHTRDLDQIHSDINVPKHLEKFVATKAREELPGFGQFYCTPCAKWFESDLNFGKHEKGKPHRRRVKLLQEEPYSQKEAEAAAGLTTDNGVVDKMGKTVEVDKMGKTVEVDKMGKTVEVEMQEEEEEKEEDDTVK
jgi:bud site selection protein 20